MMPKKNEKVAVQGILFDLEEKSMEADDDEGYYKNELSDERKAKYYRGKRITHLLEETNNSRLILFPSLGGAEGEWYKMGGTSALIYKYRIGPRLGRKVKILRDNDKRERFTHGVTSIHWLNTFAEKMKELGYTEYAEGECGVVTFDLGEVYTAEEIKEFDERAKKEHELFHDTIKPEVSYPEIYGIFIALARILPKKIRKMDTTYREMIGREFARKLIDFGGLYYGMAEGEFSEEETKWKMIKILNEMLGALVIIDEIGAMPEAGILIIGTYIADLREAVEKMLVKKPDRKVAQIGSKAK